MKLDFRVKNAENLWAGRPERVIKMCTDLLQYFEFAFGSYGGFYHGPLRSWNVDTVSVCDKTSAKSEPCDSEPDANGVFHVYIDTDGGMDDCAYSFGFGLMAMLYLAQSPFRKPHWLTRPENDMCITAGLLAVDVVTGHGEAYSLRHLNEGIHYGVTVAKSCGWSWKRFAAEAVGS